MAGWNLEKNRGNAKCRCCGKLTWKEKLECGLCEVCYESAMISNSHNDGCHKPGERMEDCPDCNGVACMCRLGRF